MIESGPHLLFSNPVESRAMFGFPVGDDVGLNTIGGVASLVHRKPFRPILSFNSPYSYILRHPGFQAIYIFAGTVAIVSVMFDASLYQIYPHAHPWVLFGVVLLMSICGVCFSIAEFDLDCLHQLVHQWEFWLLLLQLVVYLAASSLSKALISEHPSESLSYSAVLSRDACTFFVGASLTLLFDGFYILIVYTLVVLCLVVPQVSI